jgi:hypothetical protein
VAGGVSVALCVSTTTPPPTLTDVRCQPAAGVSRVTVGEGAAAGDEAKEAAKRCRCVWSPRLPLK